MTTRRLGLIVNPVAGMGGSVGLKGSDGADTQRRARELGAVRRACQRAAEALQALGPLPAGVELVTWCGEMGAEAARLAGLPASEIGTIEPSGPCAEDTRRAARAMAALGTDLLLFAGGDGTARDVCDAIGEHALVLGIPAGVKIHSAVYATTPRAAGDLTARVLGGQARRTRLAEVMDLDEDEFRRGRVSAHLYGYLRVPEDRVAVQSLKASSPPGEEASLAGIAADVIEDMEPGSLYLVGPGTTTRPILEALGLEATLLGVDVVRDRTLIARDVGERGLLHLLDGQPARIVVTPIGGQGYIFGRGNQQLSPSVIRRVGRERVLVVATRAKLAALRGEPLLVDSGDEDTDAQLRGYLPVITGYHERAICRVR